MAPPRRGYNFNCIIIGDVSTEIKSELKSLALTIDY